nr:hypothetical protein [Tanacetum cinerariifolium]
MTGNKSFITDYQEFDGNLLHLEEVLKEATIDESNLWHRRLGHINFKTMNKLVTGNLVRVLPSKIYENDHTCVSCQKGEQHKASCIKNKLNHMVKIVRCDNGTEFKNSEMNQFCQMKGIKREFSVARTPQQNKVAERKNRILIEVARTMLTVLQMLILAPSLEETCIFDDVYDDREVGAEADTNNLELSTVVSPIPTTRVHKDHPKEQIIGDLNIATQTRRMINFSEENAMRKLIWGRASDEYGELGTSYEEVEGVCGGSAAKGDKEITISLGGQWRTAYLPVFSLKEPKNVIQALVDPSWIEAMQEELLQFKLQKVFAPVARIEAIRLFFGYASFMRFIMYQMDVKSAFLYDTIEEEVYVCQPLSFEDPYFHNKVYKVEKALYGLHQAPRAWYETFSTYLLENRFRRGTIDKTLFIKKDRGDILLVQVYVDDIIFGSRKKSLCYEFKQMMHKRFQMSSMWELTFFLGLQVKQKDDGIFISEDKYAADILKKFDFSSVKTASTPIETNNALLKDKEAQDVYVHLYRSMIRSLMYLTASRPDIMFVVCACARFQVTPKTSHLHAVKRIFKYLKGQPKLGIWYPRDSPFDLEYFSDSDYAGASLDMKSTTGCCQFLKKTLISWQCKKQTVVANSATEAEYIVAASCCGQVLWIQNQMLDYGFYLMNTKIYIDNESTIYIVKNLVFHSKTKHIEIRHHFIRDSYEKKLIWVIKIYTDYNVADLLTKAFDVSRFNFLVTSIRLLNL